MADRDIEQAADQAPRRIRYGRVRRPGLRPIMSHRFTDALLEAGVIRADDFVTRVVIDAQIRGPVRVYVERLGDQRLLDVVPTLDGVEISTAPAPPAVVRDPRVRWTTEPVRPSTIGEA